MCSFFIGMLQKAHTPLSFPSGMVVVLTKYFRGLFLTLARFRARTQKISITKNVYGVYVYGVYVVWSHCKALRSVRKLVERLRFSMAERDVRL